MQNDNMRFLDGCNIVMGFPPADISASASQTADFVSLKNYEGCVAAFIAGAGSAGADTTVTLTQATAVAGTGEKALNFTEVFVKQGVSMAAIGQFTIVEQTAADTYTSLTSGESETIWAIDIRRENLDIANDFDCLRLSVTDHTAYKAGAVFYLLYGPRHAVTPGLTAITD
jgi:hypothetical protein